MTIEEVLEKTTIEFPADMSLNQAESLMTYIAKKLPANINYLSSHYMNVGYPIGHKNFSKYIGTVEITGSISLLREPFAFDFFVFRHSRHNTSKFLLMQFQIVPDREIEDYRPEIKKLWDDVRTVVNEYFKKGMW